MLLLPDCEERRSIRKSYKVKNREQYTLESSTRDWKDLARYWGHSMTSFHRTMNFHSSANLCSTLQKRLVPLQWDILLWLFPMAKRRENAFRTSAMLYTFAVLLSCKSLALCLFCSANAHSVLSGNTSCVRVQAGASTPPVQQRAGISF